MGQVPKPGLVSLRFIPEVVYGSWNIFAAHSEFSKKTIDVFWQQLSHRCNAAAAEALRKSGIVTTLLIIKKKHLLGRELHLGWLPSSMVEQFPRSAFDLADLVRLAWSDRPPMSQPCPHNICTGGDKTAIALTASSPLLPKRILQCFVNFSQATTGQVETFLVCYSWGEMLD